MTVPVQNSAKIIHFPVRGVFKTPHKWGRRHFSHHADFSFEQVKAFLANLLQNNVPAVEQILNEHGSELATVYGNYFNLPLLIAAKHDNVTLVNLLLENGACPYMAKHDVRFKYLNAKMQSYLKAITRFKQDIFIKI